MSNVQQIANVLYTTLGLVSLWYLITCWRDYKTAKLRQDLFDLRSELFEYACTGAISFDDPLYRKLCQLLNSVIRFAHQISFVRLGVTIVWEKARPLMPGIPNYMDELRSVPSVRKEVFCKLESIHQRMIKTIALQILVTSVMAFPMFALYCFYNVVRYGLPRVANMVTCETRQMVLDTRINYHLQLLEQQAVETRKIELQERDKILTTA